MAVFLEKSAESNDQKGDNIYEKESAVSAGETGDWVALPNGAGKVSTWQVSLIPSGGTARVEMTGSIRSKVIADTAQEYAWDDDAVSVATKDALVNVSAVRAVGITGSATLEVRVS